MLINNTCFCATWHSPTHNRYVEPQHWANGSDVTEFNPNPNVVGFLKLFANPKSDGLLDSLTLDLDSTFILESLRLLSSILLFYYYSVSAFCGE